MKVAQPLGGVLAIAVVSFQCAIDPLETDREALVHVVPEQNAARKSGMFWEMARGVQITDIIAAAYSNADLVHLRIDPCNGANAEKDYRKYAQHRVEERIPWDAWYALAVGEVNSWVRDRT